jgi:hypothetical protein
MNLATVYTNRYTNGTINCFCYVALRLIVINEAMVDLQHYQFAKRLAEENCGAEATVVHKKAGRVKWGAAVDLLITEATVALPSGSQKKLACCDGGGGGGLVVIGASFI